MQRICTSLASNGFDIILIGRKLRDSLPHAQQLFQQKRISCIFNKGFLFYAEYNFRLFFNLLFQPMDAVCAIDLDTILASYFISVIKRKKRIYDAHELFTEQKEIVTRKAVYKFWMMIEKFAVPKFKSGYTVNEFIADELKRRYSVSYSIIRNLPLKVTINNQKPTINKFIIYQGAVNEGRCFETLIPAMKFVNAKLVICGKGNFFKQVQKLIKENNVQDKIELKGYVPPEELKLLTPGAYIGLTLFEQTGLNQYYSLSNRFFDYVMACVPQICVAYPEYKKINDDFNIALLIADTKTGTIAAALNELLKNNILHEQLRQNCVIARETLNWQNEEKKLIKIYKNIFSRYK
jgi:glycosyltransferase involved in cell wall biosynthesis